MKVRQIRKRQQLKLGFMDLVVSERCKTDGYDPFTGRCFPVRTFRFTIKQGRGFNCWAEGRGKPWYRRPKL